MHLAYWYGGVAMCTSCIWLGRGRREGVNLLDDFQPVKTVHILEGVLFNGEGGGGGGGSEFQVPGMVGETCVLHLAEHCSCPDG